MADPNAVSGCGVPFVSAGEQVRLAAAGFESGATVSFAARAVSLGGTALTVPALADATADTDGEIDVAWTVPAAPAVGTDPAPRAYVIDATGDNPDGGAHTAYMTVPLVAYPATAPCAVADTASTARWALRCRSMC
ncbi:hypothetical protein [Candidatus Poriferisodalis sp.]|uniref:hypothetical protein n=1 Tax=Candidatus Poriferisodalis sp. TaxID=3101277 RepID=UPI003B0132E0